jgi:hypothetical protein
MIKAISRAPRPRPKFCDMDNSILCEMGRIFGEIFNRAILI